MESWLRSLEKAQAANQPLSAFEEDEDPRAPGDLGKVILDEEEIFQVCDAFDTEATKRWKFQPTRRTFELDNGAHSRTGEAKNRSEMLRQRYWIVQQRLQRARDGIQGEKDLPLIAIESLVGSKGLKRIVGTVTQMEEGKWFLEDPKASIELDLSGLEEKDLQSGFFTEGCVCVAEGEVLHDRDAFLVHALKFGPAELAETTKRAFPSTDFFGSSLDHRLEERLLSFESKHEESNVNDSFLVISDAWLDDAKVWERLKQIIAVAASAPPFALVLMGNFASPTHVTSISNYIDSFEKLADMLVAAPEILKQSRIIFVPGPTDPTPSRDVLPSPSLAKPIRDAFEKRLKKGVSALKNVSKNRNISDSSQGHMASWPSVHFTSNPVRIRYCTKQLVFFREDVTNKLRRHCFLKPNVSEEEPLSDHLVRTICDQSHLCPLSINTKPVYWNYDHAMRLYPLPDFVRLENDSKITIFGNFVETFHPPFYIFKGFLPSSSLLTSDFLFFQDHNI